MGRKSVIFLAICYGLFTYWLTHPWQTTRYANDLVGYRYQDLPILMVSILPWIVVFLVVRKKLPKLSRFSCAILGVASCVSILNVVYHAYYEPYSATAGYAPRLIDAVNFWLRLSASFAKPVVVLACLIYPLHVVRRMIKDKHRGDAV